MLVKVSTDRLSLNKFKSNSDAFQKLKLFDNKKVGFFVEDKNVISTRKSLEELQKDVVFESGVCNMLLAQPTLGHMYLLISGQEAKVLYSNTGSKDKCNNLFAYVQKIHFEKKDIQGDNDIDPIIDENCYDVYVATDSATANDLCLCVTKVHKTEFLNCYNVTYDESVHGETYKRRKIDSYDIYDIHP